MIVLGLLLILVAAGATVIAVIAPTTTSGVQLTALGVTFSATPIRMFIAGAASVLLLVVGFALISRGTRRSASSRKELRQLKKQAAAGPRRSTVPGESTTGSDRLHEGSSKDSSKGTTTDSAP